ncbi:hypothetical protein FSP39_012826 [Pinctada imbricata]|uniref:Major facilitator superfamily (MFS) profile domain-containing protein n=1 Tax=Pinctada imbricata TaxID=66713 RepID=A0AA89BVJ9_PINIB|nr:hypothetical protein FSP39_012826 [Pinctada imbricata]
MSQVDKLLSSTDIDNMDGVIEKDGVQAWIVCFSLVTMRALTNGFLHAWGNFLVIFEDEFNVSRETVAWVGSVCYGLSMTFGPVVSILVNRYGNRIVMFIGCVMCAISVLASSFVLNLDYLFGSFSLLYGVGACMAISPTMTIAPDYFDKYMTLAVGLMTAGSSVGTLIMAPLSQVLIDNIGWRNTFRCFTGTCLLSAACCCCIRPLDASVKRSAVEKIKKSPARKLMQELKLWKNRVFVVWTLAITCVMFGFYIPYVHLVSYAKDQGIPPEKGSILVMLLGGCTAFGRILFGRIVQSRILNRLAMHQLSMVVTGTAVMLLPLIKSFTGIIAYVLVIGLVDGCYVVLLPVLTSALLTGENIVSAWGFLIGTCSITFTLGPPVAGALYDNYGTYDIAFHCAGIPVIVGAIILFLIPWAQRTSKTNNIIIVVSEPDLSDEYDLVDDIDTYTKLENVDSQTNDTNSPRSMNVSSPRRRSRTIYRDQATSTSLDDVKIPKDVHEAMRMLQENARIVADMLDPSKLDTLNSSVTKTQGGNPSIKSRSELVQSSFHAGAPSKMVSIMSIPGGFTISQWEPNSTIDSTCSLPTIGKAPSQCTESQSHLLASSLQSKNTSDIFLKESSSINSSSPNMYLFCKNCHKAMDVSEPSRRPSEILQSQKNVESSQEAQSAPPSIEYSVINQQTLVISPRHPATVADASSLANKSETLVDGLSSASPGSSALSPRGRSSLSAIPEGIAVVSPPKEINIHMRHVTSPPKATNDQVHEKDKVTTLPVPTKNNDIEQAGLDNWLDNSPNEAVVLKMKENFLQSSDPSNPIHSSSSLKSNSSSSSAQQSVSKTCNKSSSHELDVFTHLFNDEDNKI